jgi:predicted O-linked N-acetylglucosamine transferase (SPINDLY family)
MFWTGAFAKATSGFVTPSDTAKFQAAVAMHRQGRLDQAEQVYREILLAQPQHFDAMQLLATIAAQRGDFTAAAEWFDRALAIAPAHAGLLYDRGLTLVELRRFDEALESFDRAIALKPDFADALTHRGNALRGLNRLAEAIRSFDQALGVNPAHPGALIGRGNSLLGQKRADEALANYDSALDIDPANVDAINNRGNALRELMRSDEALQAYDRALSLKPDYVGVLNNRGHLLRELNRYEEALESHEHAIRIDPGNAEAYLSRGILLAYQGKRLAGLADCRKALAINPAFASARWAQTMMRIPLIAEADGDNEALRLEFANELAGLDAWFEADQHDGEERVGTWSPFYLAYQEENNRNLLSSYGSLCSRLMKRWQDQQGLAYSAHSAGRVTRVGIVSAHIKNHSVWNALVKGWFRHLDRSRIELHVFHLGLERDGETAWAESRSASFMQGNRTLRDWAAGIVDKRLDALIYTEIGIDSMTIRLASLRLVPVQIAAWGHPETTGLPTIDYYLSGDAFEPQGAAENYSEKLIALPNLGCAYSSLAVTSIDADLPGLDIDANIPVLLSPGTPFKYAPQNDSVFVDIARELGRCRIVFFDYKIRALSQALRTRLESAFRQSGMRFEDHCVFVPWLSTPAFYGLMKRADVFLDTIGFSGFNTAIQAVECGLPVVTRDGRFMRGRLAGGILRRMGLQELVAATNEAYVELAVKLARDGEFRQRIRQRMETSCDVLFDDVSPVRALEDFLDNLPKSN